LITYGPTSVFRYRPINLKNIPSRFPAIVENPDATYVLLTGDDDRHYNPDLDWSRYLPTAVPLDRRSHDKCVFISTWVTCVCMLTL